MLLIGWVVMLVSATQFLGWQSDKKEREVCFVIPGEELLVAVANPIDCPIEFVTAYCIGFINGGGTEVYTIRNRSSKAIKGYTIAIVDSDGGETTNSVDASLPVAYFRPGEISPPSSSSEHRNIVPLTDQLREKYKLNGEMRVIKVFIVVRVEFADGTKYDAESQYRSLKKFFDKYANRNEK